MFMIWDLTYKYEEDHFSFLTSYADAGSISYYIWVDYVHYEKSHENLNANTQTAKGYFWAYASYVGILRLFNSKPKLIPAVYKTNKAQRTESLSRKADDTTIISIWDFSKNGLKLTWCLLSSTFYHQVTWVENEFQRRPIICNLLIEKIATDFSSWFCDYCVYWNFETCAKELTKFCKRNQASKVAQTFKSQWRVILLWDRDTATEQPAPVQFIPYTVHKFLKRRTAFSWERPLYLFPLFV